MVNQYTVDTPYPVGPVHFYVKDYNNFLVLFDTGPNTSLAKEFLKKTVDFSRLKYVFITHCHADHYGLIQFLKENTDAEIFVSKYDLFRLKNLDYRIKMMEKILKGINMEQSAIDGVIKTLISFSKEVPVPDSLNVLEESKGILKSLDIAYIRCPGHSQSDIVYLLDGFAITGDVFLRGIFQTPLLDIDADFQDRKFDNYSAFCDTILKMKRIEENYKFLPGHREYIDSVNERVEFYVKKMCERLNNIKKFLANDDILGALKSLVGDFLIDPFKTYIKLSEILFFYDFYKNPTKLQESLQRIGIPFRICF
ncbi:MBL fold metallo-hydrolase [Deferribacter thermophilus]|uniref:MBL fold metallo-hydrolase n=1 Tax=Deferribacter thermophilus TaxID=53573 RepID=UPI003C203303